MIEAFIIFTGVTLLFNLFLFFLILKKVSQKQDLDSLISKSNSG